MRILWFPGNGANYKSDNNYNGGGWTGSLANSLIKNHPEIELGMAIPWSEYMEDEKGKVKIYGIPPLKQSLFHRKKYLNVHLVFMEKIVNNFRPDLIHVFGSEHTGGLVATITNIPVVLHLQGIMNYLIEAWLPQNMSWDKFFLHHPRMMFLKNKILYSCEIERIIFKSCGFFMGRTDMDKRVSHILSPNSNYYYCSEMLRPEIYYSDNIWSFHRRNHKIIISVISSAIYKGSDVILRTAKILKKELNIDFEWRVYGLVDFNWSQNLTGINPKDCNVLPCGIINARELTDKINEADVYVHPSYIDNSPNTVCEAQLLGIPVIANNVGGVSTLIHNMEDGILIPASDPYMTASYVNELFNNEDLCNKLGAAGREKSLSRHNPKLIVEDVIKIYKDIIDRKK